jgi:hypothetical protein
VSEQRKRHLCVIVIFFLELCLVSGERPVYWLSINRGCWFEREEEENRSYIEISCALTIKEFLCKLYASDSSGCASEISTYESYRHTI